MLKGVTKYGKRLKRATRCLCQFIYLVHSNIAISCCLFNSHTCLLPYWNFFLFLHVSLFLPLYFLPLLDACSEQVHRNLISPPSLWPGCVLQKYHYPPDISSRYGSAASISVLLVLPAGQTDSRSVSG